MNMFAILIMLSCSKSENRHLAVQKTSINNKKRLDMLFNPERGEISRANLPFFSFSVSEAAAKCVDCRFWRGCCVKGKRCRVASDSACEFFQPRQTSTRVEVSARGDAAHG